MPELPDLHVFASNLNRRVLNKEIKIVDVFNKLRINIPDYEIKRKLMGSKFVGIERIGKELFFSCDNNTVFGIHLMLSGRFDICDVSKLYSINCKIIAFEFEDGQALVISDLKGLCKVTFNPIIKGGPDAFSEEFTYDYFKEAVLKNSRKNIKAFLIDQSIVKGIGNAYADEIFWKAGISPESTVRMIPEKELHDLYDAIPYVLTDAIANIERISPDIIGGEERSFLKVHCPKKRYTQDGDAILVKEIATKKTYFTDKQKKFI